jgi:CheY-like chemotaxis protein
MNRAPDEHRQAPDRRRQPRGGRRPADVEGVAPLVMVVGDHSPPGSLAEAVLAKLKFAVTPSENADEALRVLATLRPDLIVADATDAARIRLEAPEHLSLVVLTDEMRADPQLLIEAIRETLRKSTN